MAAAVFHENDAPLLQRPVTPRDPTYRWHLSNAADVLCQFPILLLIAHRGNQNAGYNEALLDHPPALRHAEFLPPFAEHFFHHDQANSLDHPIAH